MHTLHDGSKIDGQDIDLFSTYIKIDFHGFAIVLAYLLLMFFKMWKGKADLQS